MPDHIATVLLSNTVASCYNRFTRAQRGTAVAKLCTSAHYHCKQDFDCKSSECCPLQIHGTMTEHLTDQRCDCGLGHFLWIVLLSINIRHRIQAGFLWISLLSISIHHRIQAGCESTCLTCSFIIHQSIDGFLPGSSIPSEAGGQTAVAHQVCQLRHIVLHLVQIRIQLSRDDAGGLDGGDVVRVAEPA